MTRTPVSQFPMITLVVGLIFLSVVSAQASMRLTNSGIDIVSADTMAPAFTMQAANQSVSAGQPTVLSIAAPDIGCIEQVQEIVVTANRWVQNKDDVPNHVVTITPAQIDLANPQTSADLLGTTGEVFVQKSQLGGGSPMLRGFTANSVLLVVDGVRMNNAIFRAGNLQNVISVDPNSLGSVEVLFGPGSIMYGSDALGGVFSFASKAPQLSGGDSVVTAGTAMTRFSSADREKTGHIGFNLGLRNIGSYTAVSFSDFDDMRIGKSGDYYDFYKRPDYVEQLDGKDTMVANPDPSVQAPSGYRSLNVLENLTWRPATRLRFRNSFYYTTTSDFPRYDRLILRKDATALKSAEWFYGPQKWLMDALNIRYSRPNFFFDQLSATVAFQDYEESRHDRNFNARWLFNRTERVKAFSGNGDFNKGLGPATKLLYGVEAVWNDVRSSANRQDTTGTVDNITIVDTRYPDGFNDYGTAAAYGFVTRDWGTVLTGTTGARYSYVHLKSFIDRNKTFYPFLPSIIELNAGALCGSIGLIYKPVSGVRFNLNASSGFRAPNVDDIGKIFSYTAGTVRMPNNGLKPEYAYNIDLGSEATLARILRIEGAVFFTRVKDLMAAGDFSFDGRDTVLYNGIPHRITAIVNKASASIWGGSTAVRLDITKSLAFSSTISVTAGIEGNDTVPLRPVPPLFGTSHLLGYFGPLTADLYVVWNAKKTQGTGVWDMPINDENRDYLYPLENGLRVCPSWYTVNLKTSYRLSHRLTLDAGVENLLNRCYRPYGSGISASGINLISALRANL